MKASNIPDAVVRDLFMAAESLGTLRFRMMSKTSVNTYYFFQVRGVADDYHDRMMTREDLLAFCGYRRSGGMVISSGAELTYVRRDRDAWLLGTVKCVRGGWTAHVLYPRRVRDKGLYATREDAIAVIASYQETRARQVPGGDDAEAAA